MVCSKLHGQKVFRSKIFSYKILHETPCSLATCLVQDPRVPNCRYGTDGPVSLRSERAKERRGGEGRGGETGGGRVSEGSMVHVSSGCAHQSWTLNRTGKRSRP